MRTGILNKRTTFLFFARLLLRSNFYSRFSSPRSCGHGFPVPAVYIIISRGECGMTMSSACVDGETERETVYTKDYYCEMIKRRSVRVREINERCLRWSVTMRDCFNLITMDETI